jgi:NADH-quinone oxidoreductase subunit E
LRQQLASTLGVDLGGTTTDGRFTFLPTVCLGACDRAPVMMIDDELYGNVEGSQLDSILARYQ